MPVQRCHRCNGTSQGPYYLFHDVCVGEAEQQQQWCTECTLDHAQWNRTRQGYEAGVVAAESAGPSGVTFIELGREQPPLQVHFHELTGTDDDDFLGGDDYDDDEPEEEPRRIIESYDHRESSYPIQHLPTERLRPTTLALAVELEVAVGRHATEQARARQVREDLDASPFADALLKHDGSIGQGVYGPGFEIVTMPGTWAWWRTHRAAWDELLQRWRQTRQLRSFDAESCGLHIHVSRSALTPTQQVRLLTLIYDHAGFWRRLSRRRVYTYCSFVGREAEDLRQRVQRIGYTKSHDERAAVPGQSAFRDRWRHYYDRRDYNSERRVAVNLPIELPTIEFRFWRGTLGSHGFWKSLEATHAAVEYVQVVGEALCTAEHFAAWVLERPKQYPALITELLAMRAGRGVPTQSETALAAV